MVKRALDLVVSGVAIVLLAPVIAAIAAAVLLDSGSPVFYGQERVGLDFRRFRIWKFRSMRPSNSGSKITVRGDSRITRIGRVLRATKLDELPQLWNVFVGQMSLVGPRPEVPEYVEMYRNRYEAILTVRPGITDLASIQFRDEEVILAASADPIEYYTSQILPAKLDLADAYLRKRSLLLDMSIILRTLGAVVGPVGRDSS
jgi:lipopolysaccharide/colanic/teichoic acid biosynthesis glycosyltransferase